MTMKRIALLLLVLLWGVFAVRGDDDNRVIITNDDWTPIEQDFDGIPMVLVPAGCFLMGSTPEQFQVAYASFVAQFGEDDDVRQALEAEMPQHEQCFETAFWIDKYPTTQANFDLFNTSRSTTNRFLGDNRPVEVINWAESQRFCVARGGRLPTEAEWEYATRGPDGLIYSWGDDWDETMLVWNREEKLGTADVGSIAGGASWVGAYDLIGNVWEWTSTIYDLHRYPYPHRADDGRDTLIDTEDKRVLRGGAWSSITLTGFRAAYRTASRPQSRYFSLGFRCVLPLSAIDA